MRRSRGFTIIELLVVMALLSLVAGVAVGMIKRQDKTLILESNARLLRSSLRLARASAKDARVGALVEIDRTTSEIETSTAAIGGNWHLEDVQGAYGTEIAGGARFADDGVIGRCAELSGGALDLGSYAYQTATRGFRFTFWIKPRLAANAELATRARSFTFAMTQEGALTANLRVVSDEKGQTKSETIALETRSGVVRPGRWQEVTLGYDGVEAVIEVNGVPFARKADSRSLDPVFDSPLLVGGRGFDGWIDEIRLDVVNGGEVDVLNPRITLAGTGNVVVRFDGQGRLDRRYHQRPVEIVLVTGEGETERTDTIRVEMTGVIR